MPSSGRRDAKGPAMQNDFSGELNLIGNAARDLALAGAKAGIEEIHRYLISTIDEESQETGILVQDKGHAGAPARMIDAHAQEKVSEALHDAFNRYQELFSSRARNFRVIGEESGLAHTFFVMEHC